MVLLKNIKICQYSKTCTRSRIRISAFSDPTYRFSFGSWFAIEWFPPHTPSPLGVPWGCLAGGPFVSLRSHPHWQSCSTFCWPICCSKILWYPGGYNKVGQGRRGNSRRQRLVLNRPWEFKNGNFCPFICIFA